MGVEVGGGGGGSLAEDNGGLGGWGEEGITYSVAVGEGMGGRGRG